MSTTHEKSSLEQLNTPAHYLKGVGPQRAELLAKLGLHYARDLLFFFPRDYEDMSELRSIDQLEEDKDCSVVGVVEDIDIRNTMATRPVTFFWDSGVWFTDHGAYRLGPAIDRWVAPGSASNGAWSSELATPEGNATIAARATNLGDGTFRYTAPVGGGVVGEIVRFVEENGQVVRMYTGDSFVERVR